MPVTGFVALAAIKNKWPGKPGHGLDWEIALSDYWRAEEAWASR